MGRRQHRLITQGGSSPALNGDLASIYQQGSDNYASLEQTGDRLTGSIVQTNSANNAVLTQTGSALTYAIVQDGTSTTAGGITFGGVTGVTVDQTSGGVNIGLH